jgi:hypothetical protein
MVGDIKFGHVRLQSLHVVVVHRPLASLAKSVVWNGGLLRPCYGGVGGEAVETLVYYLLHTVATTDESDKHEHAPKHAESCEEGARFVAG